MKFESFKLNEKLLEAIGYMGFENASPIQEKAENNSSVKTFINK